MRVWGGAISDTALGHVQVHTGAQRFAMVSGLNDMFPGNGVQQGLRISNWDVSKMSNQQQREYNPRGIKETARTTGPSEVI